MATVISTKHSEITHLIVGDVVKHVIYATVVVLNVPKNEPFIVEGFTLLSKTRRKLSGGEYDGHYEGRITTYEFIKYLD